MKKFIFSFLVAILLILDVYAHEGHNHSTVTSDSECANFADVSVTDKLCKYLYKAKTTNIVSSNSIFFKDSPVSRSQFAGLVVRSFGLDANITDSSKFRDVNNSNTFYREIRILEALGVVNGSVFMNQRYFLPENPLTRGQAMEVSGKFEFSNSDSIILQNLFKDSNIDADEFASYMKKLSASVDKMPEPIIKGYSDGFIRTGNVVTRMEAITMLMRASLAMKIIDVIEEIEIPAGIPTPTPTITTTPTGGNSIYSVSFGKWTPSKWDTCTKEEHDSYKVQAPDGKWYPTWHPPVHVRTDGTTCTFGHEHGRNPSRSLIWDQVRNHFAYDADKNGTISNNELATAGIPFGYVNEQLNSYSIVGFVRHEDHVGHKVEYANGEPDIATDKFDNNATAGVVVPIKNASGNPKWNQSGARCYYFSKVHQGVSSGDAFTNNLHEVIYFSDCKGPNSTYDSKSATAVMMKFGKVGEFTNLCDGDGDRSTIINTGTTAANQNFPGNRQDGARNIIQRSCLEKYFLVPQGTFSMNMYEAWPGTVVIKNPAGRNILSGVNMLFDVEDANRYYDPSKPNNVGYSMDLCYEKLAGGRQARGGVCDSVTNYGNITDITWDDTRSAFKGIHRGMYFMPPIIDNAGGSEIWYSDPFGGNAQTQPFPGSVKQFISAKNVNHGKLGGIDPRVSDRYHDNGNNTVHAPN